MTPLLQVISWLAAHSTMESLFAVWVRGLSSWHNIKGRLWRETNYLEFPALYLLGSVISSWSLLGTSAEVRDLMAVKHTIRFHDC